jgi:DNA-binding NarL/FixJ family response regulator
LLETIAWISIIIGFVVVIAFSMAAMFLMRRREQNAPKSVDYAEAVRRVDAVADAALDELNKTADLILKDIEEKYQTLLFLYELTEDKLQAASLVKPEAQTPVTSSRSYGNVSRQEAFQAPREKPLRKKPMAVNAKQAQVLKLHGEGLPVAEIAKELDIGQGEVRLVIDLAERGAV